MEYLVKTHDNIIGRETTEWSNFWYDNANSDSQHRILLIGDSTVRMVRSKFAKTANCPVDMFGTSSGLHDLLFVQQMNAFFSSASYKWDLIFVQLGHHSRINEFGNPYETADYDLFEREFEQLTEYLGQYSEKIVLLGSFYSVIPNERVQKIESPLLKKMYLRVLSTFGHKEIYDEKVNAIKREKNKRIQIIAQKKHLPYIDMAQYMDELRIKYNKRFMHVDHIHYEKRGIPDIIKKYMEFVFW